MSISIAHFGSWKVPKFGSPANLLVKLPWKQRVDLAQEMSILHPEAEVLAPGTPLRSSLRSSLGRSSHRDSAPGGWSWGRMKESLKNGIHLSSGAGFRNHPGLEVWNYLEIWTFQESWGCKAADFKNHLRIWAGQGLICKWWRDLTEALRMEKYRWSPGGSNTSWGIKQQIGGYRVALLVIWQLEIPMVLYRKLMFSNNLAFRLVRIFKFCSWNLHFNGQVGQLTGKPPDLNGKIHGKSMISGQQCPLIIVRTTPRLTPVTDPSCRQVSCPRHGCRCHFWCRPRRRPWRMQFQLESGHCVALFGWNECMAMVRLILGIVAIIIHPRSGFFRSLQNRLNISEYKTVEDFGTGRDPVHQFRTGRSSIFLLRCHVCKSCCMRISAVCGASI